ncbi:Riboflavin transporter MCH5 [Nakaseomyces bracarensis]|uniref:Riboflavin transporter MCH5 n=1 Tax=Nakaseomyces bracarensis TaxID=273131 RepID=A0ABR4NZR4_9SACH
MSNNESRNLTPHTTLVPESSSNNLLSYYRQVDDKISLSSAELEDQVQKADDIDLDKPHFYTVASSSDEEDNNIKKDDNDLVRERTSQRSDDTDSDSDSDARSTDEEKRLVTDVEDFPEGGLRAWTTVLGCFCGLVACFGLLNASGVVEDHIQQYQLKNESPSTIGWVFSLFLFINFSSCIFSGTYFDRNGFRDPVILGAVLHVAGLIATANCTTTWQFILAFSIVCGFGNGILISPLVSVPAHYFNKRRGTALAMATVGGSIGGVIFPIILRKFFSLKSTTDPNYGFVWGVRTWGLIDLFLLGISILLAKERLPHVVEDEKYQQESRLQRVLRVYIMQSFDAKAFTDMKYLFCVVGTVIGEFSLCSTITYFASYSTAHGISESDAYMLIMVVNLTGILGRWIPGYMSDVIGRFNVAIMMILSLGIVMLAGWLPFGKDLTNMYVISALYGFFSGSIFSLLPVCCGQISKTEEFGRRYSTMYFVVAFGTLVAVPITGAIIGNQSLAGYQHYVIFCGVTSLLCACSFIVSRYFCVGFKMVKF